MRILHLVVSMLVAVSLVGPAGAASGAAPDAVPVATPRALPQLVDVRAVHRPGTDRVIFQFDAGAPSGVDVRYVSRLFADGSGRRIRIAGRTILQVGMHDTRTDAASPARARRAFGLPNAITAVRSGLFEGLTTYGIGLAKHAAFDVIRQPARNRVVLDIAADFSTVERQVFFLDADAFAVGREPFFVARMRPVPLGSPATGVMDQLFAGPLVREQARGLRLVRSGAVGFADLAVSGGIARLRLLGRCSSGGSTITVAGEIAPTLRQFDTVDWVKVLDASGDTADPSGPSDSIPDCLNP